MLLTRSLLWRHPWRTWGGTALLVAAIHASTLTISPTIGQDEVQIIDYGRVFLDQDTDWALSWDLDGERPLLRVFYLGPVIQELAYRLGGGSLAGPRLASILAALLSASLCFSFLRGRGLGLGIAWALSIVWLLDPLVVQGYRHARVDVWAQAICFASLLLIDRCYGSVAGWIVVGGLGVTMLFVWPTSVILLPLIAWATWEALLGGRASRAGRPDARRSIAALLLGAVLGTGLLLLPIAEQLPRVLAGVQHMSDRNLSGAWDDWPRQVGRFLSAMHRSPFLPAAACWALVVSRDKALRLAAVVATAIVIVTNPYVYRVAYLVPTMVVALAVASARRAGEARQRQRPLRFALGTLVTWAVGASLIARPAVASLESLERDPQHTFAAARSAPIGAGHSVWMANWELYYAGREQGWRMFGPALLGQPGARRALCQEMDFWVGRRGHAAGPPESCGLSRLGVLGSGPSVDAPTGPAQRYGPYELWGRDPVGGDPVSRGGGA